MWTSVPCTRGNHDEPHDHAPLSAVQTKCSPCPGILLPGEQAPSDVDSVYGVDDVSHAN
jgi:hypothetical protein